MARIESYPLDDNVTLNDSTLGTDAESGNQTKNYSLQAIANLISNGTNGTAQNNIRRMLTTPTLPSGTTPHDHLNALDYSTISTETDTFWTVSDVQLMIYRFPYIEQSAGVFIFSYDYYLTINKGKGTYGVGGGDVYGAEDLLKFKTVSNSFGGDVDADPNVYEIWVTTLGNPEDMLNNDPGSYSVTNTTKDTYFVFRLQGTDVTSPTGYELYRFTGADGTYGAGGVDTAVNGDFTLLLSTGDEQTSDSEIKATVYNVGNTGTGTQGVNDIVNNSPLAPFGVPSNLIVFFRVIRTYQDVNFNSLFAEEIYVWLPGQGTTNESIITDYERLDSIRITDPLAPSSGNVLPTQFYDVYDSSLNAVDAVNNSSDTFIINANEDQYFIVYRPLSTVNATKYAIYKYIGATGTIGFGGTPIIAGDLEAVALSSIDQQFTVRTSQLVNDGDGTSNYARVSDLVNATGLELISEGGNTGWRLIGRDPADYDDIGQDAVEFQTITTPGAGLGTTNIRGYTFGRDQSNNGTNTLLGGKENFAGQTGNNAESIMLWGQNISVTAPTYFSAFFGGDHVIDNTSDFGNYLFATGRNVRNRGRFASGLGVALDVRSTSVTVLGQANVAVGTVSASGGNLNDPADPLLVIGNGTIDANGNATATSNALVLLKSGVMTVPSLSNAEIDGATDDVLITKGWVNANSSLFVSPTETTSSTYTIVDANDYKNPVFVDAVSAIINFDGTGDLLRDDFLTVVCNVSATQATIQGINGYTVTGVSALEPGESVFIYRRSGTNDFYALAHENIGGSDLRQENSATTLLAEDKIIECTSGTFTVDLPPANSVQVGRQYRVKNSGGGTITVDGDGAETIDGSLTQALASLDSITIASNGASWIVL